MNRDKERELELHNKKIAVELGDIHLRILRNIGKIISLDYYSELFREAKWKGENIKKEDKSTALGEAQENLARVFDDVITVSQVYINEIIDGRIKSDTRDLKALEENCREVLENIDLIHEHYPQVIDSKKVTDTKEGIKSAQEKFIPLAQEFADALERFGGSDETDFSWQKVKDLHEELKQKAAVNRSEKWLTEFAENQRDNFFFEAYWEGALGLVGNNEGKDIPANFFPSTHEELDFLQEMADSLPGLIDLIKEKNAKDIAKEDPAKVQAKIQELKTKNEQLKSFIQQQRKKLGSSSPNQPKKPNPQDQQKLQTQQKEIELLKKQLTELQNQIEELKKNQNANSDQTINPEINQKIETLQTKKQEIQIDYMW